MPDLAAHLLALEVGKALDARARGQHHGLDHFIIGIGEVELLLALGRDGRGRGHDVIFARGYAAENAVPGDIADVHLKTGGLGHRADVIRGITFRLFLGVEHFHGRPGAVTGYGVLFRRQGLAAEKRQHEQGKGNSAKHRASLRLRNQRDARRAPEHPSGHRPEHAHL